MQSRCFGGNGSSYRPTCIGINEMSSEEPENVSLAGCNGVHTMMETEHSEEDIREMSMREYRKKIPSGWMELAKYESIALMIDALLASPASREFTVRELAEKAGISRKSVNTHIDSLIRVGVVEELEVDRETPRYSLNERSPITQNLFVLNRTVEDVKSGDLPKTLPERPSMNQRSAGNTIRFGTNNSPSPTGDSQRLSPRKSLAMSQV